VELDIEARLEQPMTCMESARLGKARRVDDAAGRYIEFCKSTFPNDLDLRGLKIVVDSAHGAAYHVAPSVFHELGAEIVGVGDAPNGLNINLDVGATAPEALRRAVLDTHADCGIALDGDGDRLVMIDAAGTLYDGDQLLYVIARHRARSQPVPGVAGTLMSNLGFEHALARMGITLGRARVGDRYVLELMQEKGWLFGGENSGHIICLDRHTTGDGIIAASAGAGCVARDRRDPGCGLRRLDAVSAEADQREDAKGFRLGGCCRHQAGGKRRRVDARRQRTRPAAPVGHRASAAGDGGRPRCRGRDRAGGGDIRHLEFDDYFRIFGDGYHARFRDLYRQKLRRDLSEFASTYWDRYGKWFTSRHGSFYYHGLAGFVARGFSSYFRLRPQLAADIRELFQCGDLDTQCRVYDEKVAPELWTPTINWLLGRQLTMSLIGVPHPQRRLVQAQHPGGVAGFIRDAIDYVFRNLPVAENYFWRVYLYGHYTRDCCPEYLKPDNFAALKNGLVDCIEPHTCTVTEFLVGRDDPISRFILLDHMDWMSSYHPAALIEEWNAIVARAKPGARILLRSAHANPEFLDWVEIGTARRRLADVVRFDRELAARLQRQDRVHTYAGLMIADVPA
jgi:S-adenosylmethionine-diacylglycerol 3-amino-3-carboxypropyl transferase